MKKHHLPSFFAALLFALLLCLPVSANSPAPPNLFYVHVANLPEGAVSIDLLIQINSTSSHYTDYNSFNESYMDDGNSLDGQRDWMAAQTPIAQYNEEGYMSFSVHDRRARRHGDVPDGEMMFQTSGYIESFHLISETVKLALVNKDGRALALSQAVSIVPQEADTFPRQIDWDASGGVPTVRFDPVYHSPPAARPLNALGRMLLSITLEVLLAMLLKIRPWHKVAAVNLVTQLALVAFMFLNPAIVSAKFLIIAELLVFAAEALIYLPLYPKIAKQKLVLYALAANALTLGVGLILNYLGI